MTTQQADPLIGRLVDGRYRVRARIARGGMATVYVATDMRLERRIALKVMHAHLSDDSAFQSRFIQEARAAARLADPHVVNVFDQGQDGELAYLVMEYLPGITLRELLKEQKRLSIPQTITIMDAVLSGLAAAHRAGIVHRDVKPENVLLAEDGRIKIGDFGLARATTANTATGAQLLGTIAYLAPELVTRGTADARSDIYALGIMLYEMLVGEQPYKGEQPMQIAFQHATEQVPRPSARNSAVPEQLDELVLWATEKSPDERPIDAQAMLDRLRDIERELDVKPLLTAALVTPRGGGADTGSVTRVLTGPTAAAEPIAAPQQQVDNATLLRRRISRRKARGAMLLAVVLLLAVLAGGVGWWFGSGPGSLVAVPHVAGMTYDAAAAALKEDGFVPIQRDESSVDVDAGTVIETKPGEGERLDQGARVRVIVSSGPASHQLPALGGKSESDARATLTTANLEVDDQSEEYFTPDAARDKVINVRITPRDGGKTFGCAGGCTVREADRATVQVSLGELPDVIGDPVDAAVKTLTDAGLDVSGDRPSEWSEKFAKGEVIRHSERSGGGLWRPGDSITLTVSKGPQPVEVPDVEGKNLADAMRILREAHLNPTSTLPEFLWGLFTVSKTDPEAGETVERGTEVKVKAKES
ncbi:Stk1 family PASTA domain-containing Ser/Thr kinase [Microbacterium sp. KUDC0406]|uniref:Stk1 family PASTA domain-containing Ser/Thr kinase n=1 Tax=Microbacterium sp. KUDC0406 TaxID=2909588 RepID=UPI001F230B53|nr:Stk1 family PASTA domain-containing Ser/Thr kinase [Microbacterium sp. KUDC0406]UJP10738.1 Stk1 family PASTA domain-containing Ser/Thr kinase [Microbacterium sp. KUDC0406]